MPTPLKPTLKEKVLVHEYLRTGNKTKSGLKAYNAKNKISAINMATTALKRPRVQKYMAEVLEDIGLTNEQIAKRLKSVIIAGTSEMALNEAKVSDALRAIEFTSKLKDILPAEKKQIDTRNLNMNLENKTNEEMIKMLKETQKEIREFTKMMEANE